MKHGYIKIHRQIQDCWVWERKPYSEGQAWIDLLLRASHKDTKIRFDGELVDLKVGSFITSILKLSDAWGWDRKKVTKFLNLLETDQMITKNSTTHGTTITIVKYEDFQFLGTTDGTTDGQPLPQPRDNRSPQSNNDNKVNKEKIKYIVEYLNEKAGTNFKPSTVGTQKHINARLNDGFTVEDFKTVIDKKCACWKNDQKMSQFLRPQTLFGTKFEGYLNEVVVQKENKFESGTLKHKYNFAELENM